MAQWKCTVCGYTYDDESGDPPAGAPLGRKFSELLDLRACPVCGVGKGEFVLHPSEDVYTGAGTTVSEVLMSELAAWGVTLIFRIPGPSSLGLVDAIRKNPKSGTSLSGTKRTRPWPRPRTSSSPGKSPAALP